MTIAISGNLNRVSVWANLKSCLIWMLILEVCFLVIGFPLVSLIVAAAAIVAIALQSVMSASAVLFVAGGLVGINLLAVVAASLMLTMQGVHPHEVSWLGWLEDRSDVLETPLYPACPLTCSLHP